MTVANIQAGFRETGIFPVNRNKISPALLAPSQATDNVANAQDKEKCSSLRFCCVTFTFWSTCHLLLRQLNQNVFCRH